MQDLPPFAGPGREQNTFFLSGGPGLAAYRRAEQAERNAMVRARKLREQLSLLCEQSKDRYTDAGEEISALTADLSSGLSRLQETLADIQAIFDDAESAFDELQLPGEDDV